MPDLGVTRAPRNILFGAGQRRALGGIARALGSRAFICTDGRLSCDREFAALIDDLRGKGVVPHVFDKTIPELPLPCVVDCVAAAREFSPDVMIGVGGGSCMDLAKAAAILLSHGGDIRDYYGEFKVPGPTPPLILIPTTAGTSSEVTPVAVLSDPDKAMKVGIASPHIIAHTALCDPELTYSSPANLTAIAGADALTHAIEAFTAVRRPADAQLTQQRVFIGKNSLSDLYALEAIRRISHHLRRACTHGDDPVARGEVMFGALLAGLAFGTAGTAAAHAIQYPVGAFTHTAHGAGVALLLPYVMNFNRSTRIHELAQIAVAMGEPAGGASEETLSRAAVIRVAALFARIGIPRTLADIGLPVEKVPSIAEQSLTIQRLISNNPRALDLGSLTRIIDNAYRGKMEPTLEIDARS